LAPEASGLQNVGFISRIYLTESAVKITAKLSTGKTTTLELCEINERQYAAIIDGKAPQFYVSVGEVKELIESFDILARGEDIPDMF